LIHHGWALKSFVVDIPYITAGSDTNRCFDMHPHPEKTKLEGRGVNMVIKRERKKGKRRGTQKLRRLGTDVPGPETAARK
jgi:hypothetical protein